jgi:hypothetical protein
MSESRYHATAMVMKVEAGFFSFTGVADGRDRAYRSWALLEHLPQISSAHSVLSTQWWVATPELVDRRLYAAGELAASRYLNLSLLAAPMEETLDELRSVDGGLEAESRSFGGERTYLRGAFELVKTYASPNVSAKADRVRYEPSLGVFVTAQDHAPSVTGAALDEALTWYDEIHIPDLLSVRGVVGCWWFEATGREAGPEANPVGRTVRVYWLDEDPVTFHDDLAARTPGMQMIDLRPAYTTLIVGSYRPIP